MKRRTESRGYVMVVVLMILAVLLSAGLYGIKAMEADLRASAYMRRSELLQRSAEAGAAHRMAEISIASLDSGAALTSNIIWTSWPPSGTFQALTQSERADVEASTQYQVSSQPLVPIDTRPPPGRQLGKSGQLTIWEITSYAVSSDTNAAGEHAVSVGVRLWSRSGQSYNN
jgi:hypothetical protein